MINQSDIIFNNLVVFGKIEQWNMGTSDNIVATAEPLGREGKLFELFKMNR